MNKVQVVKNIWLASAIKIKNAKVRINTNRITKSIKHLYIKCKLKLHEHYYFFKGGIKLSTYRKI